MPSPQQSPLVSLRGEPPYARALDRLAEAVGREGVQVESHSALAEYALAVLAIQHGIRLPPRARRPGRPKSA